MQVMGETLDRLVLHVAEGCPPHHRDQVFFFSSPSRAGSRPQQIEKCLHLGHVQPRLDRQHPDAVAEQLERQSILSIRIQIDDLSLVNEAIGSHREPQRPFLGQERGEALEELVQKDLNGAVVARVEAERPGCLGEIEQELGYVFAGPSQTTSRVLVNRRVLVGALFLALFHPQEPPCVWARSSAQPVVVSPH